MRRLYFLLVATVINTAAAMAQNVTQIYTDYGSSHWWTSKTDSINPLRPNDTNNLLAFRSGGILFSTGLNDAALTAHGIAFTEGVYRALPVSNSGGASTSTTFVGIGRNYSGVARNSASAPVPGQQRNYYLTDGRQGLDLATAVFNIPKSQLTFKVDEFSIAAIGDGMPDIVATQMGSYSGPSDTFKFVDVNGVTVGNQVLINFSSVLPIGRQGWAFYNDNVSPRTYDAGVSSDSARDTRIISWDLSAFGLTSSNVGNIARFVHALSGTSDQAFVAYNTSAFRALNTIAPACDNVLKPGIWLQASSGITVASGKASLWNDNGTKGLHMEQTTAGLRPAYMDGADVAFNYNPYLDFNTGNWMGHAGTPFDAATNNTDVFIVARPTAATGMNKILGVSRSSADVSSTSFGDYPAFSLNGAGALTMNYGGTAYAATGSGITGQPGLYQLNYVQGGTYSASYNGVPSAAGSSAATALGTWYTQLGDGNPGNDPSDFDVAEIIIFPGTASATERLKTETYLALKYGFSIPKNYIAGSGTVVWDYTAAAGYNNHIMGIGREDCQGLYQKQTHSAADENNMLTVGISSIAATNKQNQVSVSDEQFITWGDDNGLLTTTSSIQAKDLCLQRAARTWRAQATGTTITSRNTEVRLHVGAISWTVPVSYTGTAAAYYLLVDRNANGSYNDSADEAIQATGLAGGYATFNNVKWDQDESGTDRFTIAVKRAEMPVVSITAPAAVCPPAAINLTAPAVTSGSSAGINFNYFANPVATEVLPDPATVVTAGVYYIRGTDPASGCYRTAPVNVAFNSLPTAAAAGPDQSQATTTFTMAGNAPASGEAGTWTVASVLPAGSSVTIADIHQQSTTVTIPEGVTANLIWTINNASCATSDALLLIAGTPLPVSLVSFEAAVSGGCTAEVRWESAAEHGISHYEVEQSTDSRTWTAVAAVQASGKASGSSYATTVALTAGVNNYLRLKMTDQDGSVRYGMMRALRCDGKTPVILWPNPAGVQVQLSGLPAGGAVRIVDATGRTVLSRSNVAVTETMQVAHLAAGIYQVIITDKEGAHTDVQQLHRQQ